MGGPVVAVARLRGRGAGGLLRDIGAVSHPPGVGSAPMSDQQPTDASGAPLVTERITCIDCGGVSHLLSRPDDTGRFWPGDLVVYRCEDCMDRWDLIVPDEGEQGDGRADW